ncbi:MAG TPA: glucose 1-dehydrogenase [Planctomycetota bacterium]|nr:glucose 1-dehydrogenase [Planctomycetota bacterium]
MSNRLAGKVAVITGGTSGIGLATAEKFVAEGADVFVTGRRPGELEAAVKKLGKKATGVQGDVATLADLDRLYDAVKRKHDHVDVVFANAGRGEYLALGAITEKHYDETFDTNVKGLLFSVQKALPLMRPGGSIILNASVAGSKGFDNFSVYSATKAAVRSFARTWTTDLKGRGIRVNVVSPGPIDTPIIKGLAPTDEAMREFKANMSAVVPMGRMGRAEEVANAVVFLASDESSFVTGTEVFVDGGVAQV